MIKPERLQKGDKVALVSLSSGIMGDARFIHRYYIAKERLENLFGLEVVTMPHALMGSQFIYEHPEARAKDLMDAFLDDSVKAIICAIGGDDTIRLLPYIDFDIIHNHPKIFMGYSDTTINHFMMHKAGLVSFYGPCVMSEFGEYGEMFEYTEDAVRKTLFEDVQNHSIEHASYWANHFFYWNEENINRKKFRRRECHGYETIQGEGVACGELLGGCIDVFPMMVGTSIWPAKEEWNGKILLVETSEVKPTPEYLLWYLRNLGAQGVLEEIIGIVVGKPQDETFYEEYKEIYRQVLKEYHREKLPVLYNLNIGHADPIGVFPLGTKMKVNFTNQTITFLESPTKEKSYQKVKKA